MLFSTIGVETKNCNGNSILSAKEELTHLFLGGGLGFVGAGIVFVDIFKNNIGSGLHLVDFPSRK